jgi:hypothetical protein
VLREPGIREVRPDRRVKEARKSEEKVLGRIEPGRLTQQPGLGDGKKVRGRLEEGRVRLKKGLIRTNEGLRQTNQDLGRTKEDRCQTNQDLGRTNKDHRQTNEVLLRTDQDLCQTNQDLGRTNEDRRQANEDLGRTNADLFQTNQDLGRTNEDRCQTNTDLGRTNAGLFQTNTALFRANEGRFETKDARGQSEASRDSRTNDRRQTTQDRRHRRWPMSTTKSVHRSIVSLDLPKKVPSLITYTISMVTAMTGNPSFPTPAPTLAEVTAAITALQTAESAAVARTKGAVTARNDKKAVLVTLLQEMKAYIQKTADANADNSATIIQSAGVSVKKTAVRPPRVFSAVQGEVSGSAKLVTAAAGHRASYEWETSADGGKTWVTAPPSLQAKTTITGLPAGNTVQFRYRAVTKTGAGDWSQPVSLLVK